MAKRRTGIDPLAYMGVEPSTPAQFVVDNRDPTTNDYDSFNLQTVWLNKSTHGVWMLVSKTDFVATWVQFTSNISAVNTLTGNSGGAVPATAGNINVIGDSPYIITGDPGTSTLTLSDDGSIATTYDADSGSATPSGNVLNVVGGTGVTVTGSGNTLTINASSSNLEILTDLGVPVSPDMSILEVYGDHNITTTGISPNIISVSVSGTTNHAVQIGNSTGSLTSVGPLTTGQLLIGVTGSDPNPARLTAGSNITIDDTSTPGQITISSTGGGGGGSSGCCLVSGQTPSQINTTAGIRWYCTSSSPSTSVQADNQTTVTETGSFTDMFVYVSANTSTTDTTVTLNLNSVNTSLVVTIPAGMTGVFSDTTHSVSVNQGDLIQFEGSQSTVGTVDGVITVTFNCAGSGGSGSVKISTYTTSDTWIKDSRSKWIKVQITGTGSGGGSGRRGSSGFACGGGGGFGMSGINMEGPASTFPASVAVTIGAGGLGGASIAVNNTDGNPGGLGTPSSFGNIVCAILSSSTPITIGARGGGSASTPPFFPGFAYQSSLEFYNTAGFIGAGVNEGTTAPINSTGPIMTVYALTGSSGGAGGPAYTVSKLQGSEGLSWIDSSGNILYAGGAGGIEGGTIDGGNGLDASTFVGTWNNMCGTGGGGGGGQSLGSVSGNGGDGGYPGGSGGGGGGSLNGTNSGAGGDGQAAIIYVYEFL
jgi:hypothetical protein